MQKCPPIYPIHPGEILADELAERSKNQDELAGDLHVPVEYISRLLAGEEPMTADIALRLEIWLGKNADFWMNLQMRYELDLAREKASDLMSLVKPLSRTR